MWISRIELTNFKSYAHQKLKFPKPQNGRNLVLIGGINGYGKTTLLEAIYLCFYGKDASTHLARAGLHDESYGKFLKKALHGKPSRFNQNFMEVLIEFKVDDDSGYEISRKWHYNSTGEFDDEEVKVYPIRRGVKDSPCPSDELNGLLEDFVVPVHLAPFFFFDGEEVKQLADQNRKEWIKKGMENLFGVVLLRGLKDRLEQYLINKRSGTSSMDENKIQELFKKYDADRQQLEELNHEKLTLDEKQLNYQTLRDNIQQRLNIIGAGGGDIKRVEGIVSDEYERKNFLSIIDKKLESLLSDKLPFHLVNPKVVNNLREQLSAEEKRLEWEAEKQGLEPKKERFMDSFFSHFPYPSVSQQLKPQLEECLNYAWQSLFYPKPDGLANEIIHDYLERRQRQKLDEQFSKISISIESIKSLLQSRFSLEKEIHELGNQRIRLDSLHDDGTLQQLLDELKTTQSDLDELNRKIGDLDRRITSLTSEVHSSHSTFERENEKYIAASPAKSNVRKAERVIKLIDELLPKLFSLKTQEISREVTKIFKMLSHKQQVDRIEVNERGESSLHSKEGNEITLDRSAGENQIFATAIIAGLAKTSGFHIPLIVDTPLGRLDVQHRDRILEYWLSDADRQVILLSHDAEIAGEFFETLADKVAKTYLLKHEQLGHGVGKTVAIENQYFGVPA
ncbi:MAG: DNA sulfur modification protein DndD [Candidatus Methylumidiphilus sp.]